MTQELLSATVATILSLGFSYIPGLSSWFDDLNRDEKQLIMGVALVGTAFAVFGLSCAGVLDSVSCSKQGAVGFLGVLFSALIANQSVYQLTKK